MKVRDELKMRVMAYEHLQVNSNRFGLEKQSVTALEVESLAKEHAALLETQQNWERQRVSLLEKKEVLEKETTAKQQEEHSNRTKEINQLMQQQEQLEIFLEALGKNFMPMQQL